MRRFNVKVNGQSYRVEVEEVVADKQELTVPTVQQIQHQPQITNNINGTNIDAPMPGSIIKVLKKDGDTVQEGDVLFVLEAMKMENDIIAPTTGKINIKVAEGANIATGDTLATIIQ